MTRRKLIAGNWKMNMKTADGKALAEAVFDKCRPGLPFDILICPPMSLLGTIAGMNRSAGAVGAQDVAEAPKPAGAYTGDISAEMVKDLGAAYTLVGHSERRTLHGETDAVVRTKAANAIAAGLTAVVCIGETLAERESGKTLDVLRTQVNGSVPPDATAGTCVVAYEPVWAIGTGKVPTNADVAEAHAAIRAELGKLLGAETADALRILYGGSVKPSNAAELLAIDNVDGALIGGASLKIEDFWGIAETQQ
ncbi:MAG: triose-phosphate isomerase [Alphaproteobacteria bacterium]|nr:triose-phosphate isomerase [Alphaproteobacteria bacterium]